MNYLRTSHSYKALKAAALLGALLIPAASAMAADTGVSLTCSPVSGVAETWACEFKRDGAAVAPVVPGPQSGQPFVVWATSGVNVTYQSNGSIQVQCQTFTDTNGRFGRRVAMVSATLVQMSSWGTLSTSPNSLLNADGPTAKTSICIPVSYP